MTFPKIGKLVEVHSEHFTRFEFPLIFFLSFQLRLIIKHAANIYYYLYEIKQGIVPDDDTIIAVKKLQENAPMPADKTFIKEVLNVMALKHKNIVELVGFCSETQKKLVLFDKRYITADITESLLCYEYLPKGSLQENLFCMLYIIS